MSERLPCEKCYQSGICECEGRPVYTSVLLDGTPCDVPLSPAACFYHCCQGGALAATQALRRARQTGTSGWIPFKTEHKPYIDGVGRDVAAGVDGHPDGDVVVWDDGEPRLVTNVLTNPPRRRAHQVR